VEIPFLLAMADAERADAPVSVTRARTMVTRAQPARGIDMAKAWKVIVSRERLAGGLPAKEYYLVAISDRAKVVQELWIRRGLINEKIEVVGEASEELLDWWDVRDGQIFCAHAVS